MTAADEPVTKPSLKYLITGGAGFIGSHLAHRLALRGDSVTVIDDLSSGWRDNLLREGRLVAQFVKADVRNAAIAPYFQGIDSVVHLAGIAALPECQANPAHAFEVNTAGTANVLEAARRAGVRRVVFASTSAVYEASSRTIHTERERVEPNLVYASSKLAAEGLCRAFAANYGMDVIIARFFNVYGAHQDALRKAPPFTSYLARELVQDRVPVLFNKTDVRRDYINVADLIDLLLRMLNARKKYRGDIFNAASGHAYSVPELCDVMRKVSGKDIVPRYEAPEGYWDAYGDLFGGPYPLARARVRAEVFKEAQASNTKARREFKWAPAIGIEDGLRAVYEYSLRNRHRLK